MFEHYLHIKDDEVSTYGWCGPCGVKFNVDWHNTETSSMDDLCDQYRQHIMDTGPSPNLDAQAEAMFQSWLLGRGERTP